MTETVRAIVSLDEYESPWEHVIYVPDQEYASSVFMQWCQQWHRDDVYDLPKALVDKYNAAIKARDEADDELREIVREGRGKVARPSPGLPPV